LENLPREECTADETHRAGILSHPRSVHSIVSRQNEGGYQLEYGKHIIQSFGFVSTDRENGASADRGDQYPFATVYDQELGFYSFRQETMSNPQQYVKFNTKVDVGSAISITRQHKVLLEYMAQENHRLAFTALSAKQKQVVCKDAEESYISYAFLHPRGAQQPWEPQGGSKE
jgi:hypothetical protein